MKSLRVISLTLFSLFLVACSAPEKKSQTAEDLFKRAQEFEADDRFEEAIRRYQEVRSRFPYSPQALEAELAVADVYYKQESYPESQVAYQTFAELHPKHPKVAYVYFRQAMSLYLQLPETIDRDLSLAPEALLAFNQVIKKYPNSEFVAESQAKRLELVKKMAEKEIYIADFYFKKKFYASAVGRYESAAKEYLGIGLDEKILSHLVLSAVRSGDKAKARSYADQLEKLSELSTTGKQALQEARQ
jgi:outer membrane protein assembly factor BamD